MADFATAMASTQTLSAEQQKSIGQAATASMGDQYNQFLKTILTLIDSGVIDVYKPQTFLKQDIYSALPEEWKDKTDLALLNIANLLQNIYLFRVSKQTPDESPILASMIEQLWQMKQRIEEHHDVFIF